MKLGTKIKTFRENGALTQIDLANLTGISRSSIQLYEADKVEIPAKNLEKIAQALKLKVDIFFEKNLSISPVNKSVNNMQLSEKIKNLRSQKGWTQGDLAKFSGVSLGSIKRYETDSGNITYSNLQKIANSLGIELTDFLSHNLVPQVSHKQNNAKISEKKEIANFLELEIRTLYNWEKQDQNYINF